MFRAIQMRHLQQIGNDEIITNLAQKKVLPGTTWPHCNLVLGSILQCMYKASGMILQQQQKMLYVWQLSLHHQSSSSSKSWLFKPTHDRWYYLWREQCFLALHSIHVPPVMWKIYRTCLGKETRETTMYLIERFCSVYVCIKQRM